MGLRTMLIGIVVGLGAVGCEMPEDRGVRWSYIHAAIIEPSCTTATCHSRLTAIAAVDLANAEGAYAVLTGTVCEGGPVEGESEIGNFVTPGSSDYSILMYQLRGETADGTPYRDVMPPDFRLPRNEIELIARWIDEGAACD